jgi:hypothetical protein
MPLVTDGAVVELTRAVYDDVAEPVEVIRVDIRQLEFENKSWVDLSAAEADRLGRLLVAWAALLTDQAESPTPRPRVGS